MVVKVQLSLYTNNGKRRMLVYNQDRSIQYEAEATKDVIKLMGGGNKRYFEAVLDGNNKVNLGKPLKEQYW